MKALQLKESQRWYIRGLGTVRGSYVCKGGALQFYGESRCKSVN